MSSPNDARTRGLLARHFEAGLDEAEAEELRAVLDADASARDMLVRMSRREALLAEMVRSQAGAPSADEEAIIASRADAQDDTDLREYVPVAPAKTRPHSRRSRRRSGSGRSHRRSRDVSASTIAVVVSALAAAAALVLYLRTPTAPAPKRDEPDAAAVASVRGTVTLTRGASSSAVDLSTVVRPGDRLSSGADGAVSFCYPDGTTVALSETSTLDLRKRARQKRFLLATGTLRASVAKQPPSSPLTAGTSHASVVVVGTRFTLSATLEESTVEVHEGVVEFEHAHHDGSVRVVAGRVGRATVGGVALVPLSAPAATVALAARVRDGLVALYEFRTRSGRVARDSSGNGTPMNLYVQGGITWLRDRDGVRIHGGRLVSDGPASKVLGAIMRSRALTIEIWCTPAEAIQVGPGRIVTLSNDTGARNITLGHGIFGRPGNDFTVRFRTTEWANGTPELCSPLVITTRRAHCATTYDGATLELYLDGERVGTQRRPGDMSNWDASFPLAFGNEGVTWDRPWRGELYLVAIYARRLSAAEIRGNYDTGKTGRQHR